MKTLLNDESAQPSFIVRLDAQEQHAKYWATHTLAKRTQATSLKTLAELAFFRSKVYLNAREKFIVVKIDRPHMADKLQNAKELKAMNDFVTLYGIEVLQTKNALLFRVMK